MIQLIADKYKKQVACLLVSVFYLQFLAPLYAAANSNDYVPWYINTGSYNRIAANSHRPAEFNDWRRAAPVKSFMGNTTNRGFTPAKLYMGGPSSPEASTFKAIGSNNLVNLFSGDFSYSIPLLDVGGYPVNLFYNGGITMEQEASWVGLGWNINPGSVSRNMRGVPDDFDGTDMLRQTQNTKPNRTWGGEVGVDGELLGIKEPNLGLSVGFSYNNYLGPALETGATVSVSLPIMESIKAEKAAIPNVGLSVGAKLSSRSGLTFSPSLSASAKSIDGHMGTGVGLSTSYNSRSGIASLNLHAEQTKYAEQKKIDVLDPPSPGSPKSASSISLGSSSISFSKPSFMPTMRMPMQNSYTSGQVEFGAGAFGLRGSATLDGYYSESKVASESYVLQKPLVGFLYAEKANGNVNAVMDFNRVNDAEVTPNTPIISAPMYTYDIFSIQGEGTGGSIRAYRGDLGIMRDNVTNSKDGNLAIGIDLAPPGHYGVNVNSVSAPTRVGGWENNNNTLRQTMVFQPRQTGNSFENFYFRNPGEIAVTTDETLNRIGRDSLVRFRLSGTPADPRIESQLELFGKKTGSQVGLRPMAGRTFLPGREKRTQVITMLTAADATKVGLEKVIRNYRTGDALFAGTNNSLVNDTIQRVSDYRKKNHISEIDVLEQNGMRYVYGIPVYNIRQKDFTFSVGSLPDAASNLVTFNPKDTTVGSDYMANGSKTDGYLEIKETPAYASSFLITGLLSPDYVDVTGNGITEDDLGGAVKFNYTLSADKHKWQTPRDNHSGKTLSAHFNEGKRTEKRDDKATISYGEREAWYLNSIESKAMVAIFKTDTRSDAKGVMDAGSAVVNTSENANKKLTRIDLYTKADIRANGIANAKAVKSVLFEYNYTLCKKTPDNVNADSGKLTLTAISFAYNGQSRSNKERYVFNYDAKQPDTYNPNYAPNASDRWGTYKPVTDNEDDPVNPAGLNNIDYPYSSSQKDLNDQFAAAWSLKKILLPSGAEMQIQYEADDYGYVQDRRACNMYPIYGLGNSTAAVTNNGLYNKGLSDDNLYVYVKIPQPLENTDPVKRKAEIYAKYLAGLNQLAFKLQINMPKGAEPLTVYATSFDDYGLCSNSSSNDIIYIKMSPLDGKSPLAKTAIGFLVENLTGQAFPGYDASEVNSLSDFLNLMGEMLTQISKAFENADNQMRSYGNARTIVLNKSFIRLDNPGIMKYGGGSRVKRVTVRDNWDRMTGQYASVYGQDYYYTTTASINGKQTTVSSGVASYEPAIGSEENPFREILGFSNKLPLASAQYGAIEMPMLEAFYPSPNVGYSKVTVRSIHRKGTHGDSTLRSAIGKQVTEFYTAKDYPAYATYTPMNSMDYKKDPFFSFFNKEVINRRIISQGFLVETNDMHGKMKSQAAYSESDEKTPLSYSYHSYKNTGKNGLNDKVDFVYNSESGAVRQGTMGVDMELMTDVREFSIESRGTNVMGQVDIFFLGPFTILFPTVYRSRAYIENKYRAVTCTKLINYHAIEDSILVMDKGSVVSTKTVAYDAETGSPLVTQTANEFNDPVYNISYPAWWAYSGTGPASKNIDLYYDNVSFSDGRITAGVPDMNVFESGDELYITSQSAVGVTCPQASVDVYKLWALDKNKNTTALTVPVKDLVFIDSIGRPFTKSLVNFRIIRSGHRNNLGLTVSSAAAMKNPIQNISGARKLIVDATDNIVAASAISFKEKWLTDRDVVPKTSFTLVGCDYIEGADCNGTLPAHINPYLSGLLGNLKPYRSYTYYSARAETDPTTTTAIRKNGYISGFSNYWGFDLNNNLVPDYTNTNWVWNSELTKVNAHGQELETKDALDRYTAAQYGFAKNLPVAMTQNARYGQAFGESFEDYEFNDIINQVSQHTCDSEQYISFRGLANRALINTDTLSFKAHTGKYALEINNNTQVIKPLIVRPVVTDSFNMKFGTYQAGVLDDTGGNVVSASSQNGFVGQGSTSAVDFVTPKIIFQNGGMIMNSVQPVSTVVSSTSSSATYAYSFNITVSYYIQVNASGNYNFSPDISTSGPPTDDYISMDLQLYKVDSAGNTAFIDHLYRHNVSGSTTALNVPVEYLCKGVYFLQISMADNLMNYTLTPKLPDGQLLTSSYGFSLSTTFVGPNYRSLSRTAVCPPQLLPISSSDSMLHPYFGMVPGTRMHFSAWVREKCDSIVCSKPSYLNNHVELQFPGSGASPDTMRPVGTIIEGWQKIEGEFTVPANATIANLVLSNDGGQPVYFDDIRIHPFNANMKTYVYDTRTLRQSAEMDENNYASFYEYDEEGQLIRVKKETTQGIKTIKETRSAKQKGITDFN